MSLDISSMSSNRSFSSKSATNVGSEKNVALSFISDVEEEIPTETKSKHFPTFRGSLSDETMQSLLRMHSR